MAKAVVNPQAQLMPRPRDVQLSLEQLGVLGVFASLKKSPAFAKFPGSYVLRHYRAGEVICRQGEAGGTAFYLLTAADVEALLQQLAGGGDEVGADRASRQEFQSLLQRARTALAPASGTEPGQPRRLATARLLVDTSRQASVQRGGWLKSMGSRNQAQGAGGDQPSTIANDGPTDIDYGTRQAAIFEGEVFGEMSCLSRQPRSATIVVDTECFALEFLRNILDQMRKDADYKKRTEEKYRERVLEGHLRQLSIFRFLNDREYRDIQDRVELMEVTPGTVIWDEGDASDSLCVVRSGIVQIVQSFPWRLTAGAVTSWPKLWESLRGAKDASGAAAAPSATSAKVWSSLPKAFQDSVPADASAPTDGMNQQLLDALNEVAKTDVLLSAKEMQAAMSDPRFARQTADYPAKVKTWTGMQIRRGNRVLYHLLFPDAIAPPEPIGLTRVLHYLGRGATIGEMGLVLKQPRSASCVAYSHPEPDRESTGVELVRVPADVVREIETRSPQARAEIEKLAASRGQRDRTLSREPLGAISQSRRAEELGLMQGQNLMLIDLNRCTRCGDCVEACIATHDDGHSRLYLDGPRFGKFLIPSSCRRCRDPVCMIGCPVGSIQQGDNGEIRIREWCIGCGVCARQCPYDSIQMHDAAVIPAGAPDWLWIDDLNVAGDKRWTEAAYRDAAWRKATTPFSWGIDLQQSIMAAATRKKSPGSVGRLFFRYRFPFHSGRGSDGKYQLVATTQGESLEVFLNGRRLELSQDAPQKKRGEYAATISSETFHRSDNLLAASVKPPKEFNATVLDLRLDELAPESEEVEEKLVTEQAVVCDQCSSLSGNRHACVEACPHEAALRIDAWVNFPQA